ncbi:MAG: hypothetical protein EA374_08125 [Acholeplasmatales bacterium]|nr:MAG: hypothetical protein EA374_08125 [Acholeplasmatales bacterium]
MRKFYVMALAILGLFVLTACENGGSSRPVPLTTPLTDGLTLDVPYEGMSFINDGIGIVTLDLCIDGDTTRFREGSQSFSVRYLGINTPESTGRIEPWGRAASTFVCEILERAETIVIEADPNRDRIDSTGNRYLGYVWADGRLLNLEIIENAFSRAIGWGTLKYGPIMFEADAATAPTGRHIHGQTDPNYDYDQLDEEVTIAEIVQNPEDYMGRYLTIQGIISRTEAGHPWIQDGEYGIYLYRGFTFTTRLAEGNEVRIQKLQLTYFPTDSPALQLTNLMQHNIELISTDNVVEPLLLQVDELGMIHVGRLVSFENLTLKSSVSGNEFTVLAEDAFGNEIQIRKNVRSAVTFEPGLLVQGTRINITGPIHNHYGRLQLVITLHDDVEILD